jgi:hypothetical protein
MAFSLRERGWAAKAKALYANDLIWQISLTAPCESHKFTPSLESPMTTRTASFLAVLVLLAIALPAAAHHGTNISYDRAKMFTTQATVIKFDYKNPHPELHVTLKQAKDGATDWSLELLPNPAQLIRNGWSRAKSTEVLKPGTSVMVTIAPSKAGGVIGLLLRVTNMQGEELVTGGGGPGGQQADPEAGRQGGAGRGSN